jgi:hypothetical protein
VIGAVILRSCLLLPRRYEDRRERECFHRRCGDRPGNMHLRLVGRRAAVCSMSAGALDLLKVSVVWTTLGGRSLTFSIRLPPQAWISGAHSAFSARSRHGTARTW